MRDRDALVNYLYDCENQISDDIAIEILSMYDEQRKEIMDEMMEFARRF